MKVIVAGREEGLHTVQTVWWTEQPVIYMVPDDMSCYDAEREIQQMLDSGDVMSEGGVVRVCGLAGGEA